MTGKLSRITRDKLEPLWCRRDVRTARIAEALGVTRAGLSLHARKLGLPSRARNQAPKECGSDKHFRKLWLAGVSSQEIAQAVGYAHGSAVGARARRLGLPARMHGNASGFYAPDGSWQPHTPITDIAQDELARAWRASLEDRT